MEASGEERPVSGYKTDYYGVTASGGVVRLERWPEGHVLWWHGEIVFRSWEKPRAQVERELRDALTEARRLCGFLTAGKITQACRVMDAALAAEPARVETPAAVEAPKFCALCQCPVGEWKDSAGMLWRGPYCTACCAALLSTNPGVALQSTSHPIEVTPDMVEAGRKAWQSADGGGVVGGALMAVYRAMAAAAPPVPDDVSADSLETAEIDLPQPEPVHDIGWAMKMVKLLGISVRRPGWSDGRILFRVNRIIFTAIGHEAAVWSPAQTDVMATDWEFAPRELES